MAYCSNCGNEVREGAKFCDCCGTMISIAPNQSRRESCFEGTIHKCPNCGEILNSFVSHCPSCNYEIRNSSIADSVKDFSLRLSSEGDLNKRIELIRNYPIPNTMEEILEFMILASSNMNSILQDEQQNPLRDAWSTKFEQGYQKAQLIFGNRIEFGKIQEMYQSEQKRISKGKKKKIIEAIAQTFGRNIIAVLGIIGLIYGVIVNKSGENSSMIELAATFLLFINACTLVKRKTGWMGYLISAGSGVLAIIMSGLLDNGSIYKLVGGMVIFITIIVLIGKSTGKFDNI